MKESQRRIPTRYGLVLYPSAQNSDEFEVTYWKWVWSDGVGKRVIVEPCDGNNHCIEVGPNPTSYTYYIHLGAQNRAKVITAWSIIYQKGDRGERTTPYDSIELTRNYLSGNGVIARDEGVLELYEQCDDDCPSETYEKYFRIGGLDNQPRQLKNPISCVDNHYKVTILWQTEPYEKMEIWDPEMEVNGIPFGGECNGED